MMLAMGGDVEHDGLFWDDDQSWAFPILQVEEDGGKMLIDSGKILMGGMGGVPEQQQQQPAADKLNEECVPPPPQDQKGKKKVGGGGESDDHELHIWTERERRKKMRNMFASLHSLIPHLHPRADKSTTVDEAVVYIKKLQQTVHNLEKQKEILKRGADGGGAIPLQSREAFLAEQGSTSKQPPPLTHQATPNNTPAAYSTWTSPNIVLNIYGNDAHINIVCCPIKPRFMTAVAAVMEKNNIEVVSAQVSYYPTTRFYMIHARANVDPQQMEEMSYHVEEAYRKAVAELMIWMDS